MPALRQLLILSVLIVSASFAHAEAPVIEFKGRLVNECTLPGETRKDDVVARHGNAIQLSADRWLVGYATHSYRGVDDERSIVYQVRKDGPDGPVIKEGFLVQTLDDWKPPGAPSTPPGRSFVKQHGHIVLCGVPKGAIIDGKPASHANTFIALWRVVARPLVIAEKKLEKSIRDSGLFLRTQGVEWVQFRLNEKGDDIEFIQPVRRLRQKGFETGREFCELKDVVFMNQSFCPPVPYNAARTEWVVANHFDQHHAAAVKFRFNPESRLYEWVQTGPLVGDPKQPCWEASLLHSGTNWVLAARSTNKVAWAKTADPFKEWSKPVYSEEPTVSAPLTAFRCADGVVRLFTGDKAASEQKYDRDPLYCFDVTIAPEFSVANRRVIFDSRAARLPIRPEARSKVDFCKLFPLNGNKQLLVFSVCTRAYNFPYEGRKDIPELKQEEKDAAGIYYATLTYSTPVAPTWTFEEKK